MSSSSWSIEHLQALARLDDATRAAPDVLTYRRCPDTDRGEKPAAVPGQEKRVEVTRALCWLPRYQTGLYASHQENDGRGWCRHEEIRQLAGRIGYRTVTQTFRARRPAGEDEQDTPGRGRDRRLGGLARGKRRISVSSGLWSCADCGQGLCACPPLTRYSDRVPGPPADSQEALHREVTGRAPAPTWEGWRDEFAAFGGDYARDRMLSYVTLDTRCVIDPPETDLAPGAPARRRQIHALAPRTQGMVPILISVAAFAVVLLVVAGAVTAAAILILVLSVVAVIRQ